MTIVALWPSRFERAPCDMKEFRVYFRLLTNNILAEFAQQEFLLFCSGPRLRPMTTRHYQFAEWDVGNDRSRASGVKMNLQKSMDLKRFCCSAHFSVAKH